MVTKHFCPISPVPFLYVWCKTSRWEPKAGFTFLPIENFFASYTVGSEGKE